MSSPAYVSEMMTSAFFGAHMESDPRGTDANMVVQAERLMWQEALIPDDFLPKRFFMVGRTHDETGAPLPTSHEHPPRVAAMHADVAACGADVWGVLRSWVRPL